MEGTRDTQNRILDVAERLAQTRGFNGFSYADISAELDIRKASIHYHFPTKGDLGKKLIGRYHEVFRRALADIDARAGGPHKKLERYVQIYVEVLRGGRMCLCGMLAADYATLPEPVRAGVSAFFDDNETWLQGVLAEGRTQGVLRFAGPPRMAARILVSSLEGAMLIARSFDDVGRFESIAQRLLSDLRAKR